MLTMAPSLLLASGQFGLRSFVQSFDNTLPQEATIPSNAREGDLLVLCAGAARDDYVLPAGWTLAFQKGGSTARGFIIWKVAGPSDAGSTVTYLSKEGVDTTAIVTVWGNAAFSVVGTHAYSSSSTAITIPSITTLSDDDIVCPFVCSDADAFSLSLATSGYDLISSDPSAVSFNQTAGLFQRKQAVAGATGTVDVASGAATDTTGVLFSLTSTL